MSKDYKTPIYLTSGIGLSLIYFKFYKSLINPPTNILTYISTTDISATDISATDISATDISATDISATDISTSDISTSGISKTNPLTYNISASTPTDDPEWIENPILMLYEF